ncbi:hypothetical protein C8Q74DRAFT_1219001 [Fomes fomentarius]|nr:hypothetical protein C8Q74DRAFT_1219001 [Fomes fomentarius]
MSTPRPHQVSYTEYGLFLEGWARHLGELPGLNKCALQSDAAPELLELRTAPSMGVHAIVSAPSVQADGRTHAGIRLMDELGSNTRLRSWSSARRAPLRLMMPVAPSAAIMDISKPYKGYCWRPSQPSPRYTLWCLSVILNVKNQAQGNN